MTPSYNQGAFIEETLLSVREQRYPNLEHIVVDGGSTDTTIEVLRRYEDTYDLKWSSEPDAGQSDAINKGLQRASGDVIGWLNSDDTYLPSAIVRSVQALQAQPKCRWSIGEGLWIDGDSRVLAEKHSGPYSFRDLVLRGMYVTQPSMFIKSDLLNEVGLLDTSIHTTMDYDLCLRFGAVSDAAYVRERIATRRLHDDAKSIGQSTAFYPDAIASLDKLFARDDLADDIRQLKDRSYAHRHMVGAIQAYAAGEHGLARRLIRRSLTTRVAMNAATLKMLILYAQSIIGVEVTKPGRSRRLEQTAFAKKHGTMSVKWVADQEPPSANL